MMLALRNLLFTVLIPGTAAVYLPLSIAGDDPPATGFARVAAVVLLGAGASIYAWCVWDFAAFGRGTAFPADAPKRLVVRGLYRWSRNPMYMGVLATILGWAVWFAAPALLLYALGVWTLFQTFVTAYEEPHLPSAFGSEYEEYCARVGRWLPRLARRSA